MSAEESVHLVELDVLARVAELTECFCAIRASNLLNPVVFAPEALRVAIANLHAYLLPEGLLLVSRSTLAGQVEHESGTVWRKTRAGFAKVTEFGGGSEIKKLVEGHVVPV